MANPDVLDAGEAGHQGALNYLDEDAEPSLFRNGKVFTRRDEDGSDTTAYCWKEGSN